MPSLTREQLIGAGLALAMTLGTVGYMVIKGGELAEATAKAKADRASSLDLK